MPETWRESKVLWFNRATRKFHKTEAHGWDGITDGEFQVTNETVEDPQMVEPVKVNKIRGWKVTKP